MALLGSRTENLIWVDLEMTGLDTTADRIIEIATIVTDGELNTVAEGPVLAIAVPDDALDRMDDWNRSTHGASGLIERIRREGVSTREAELRTLEFLRGHVDPGVSPICGNSIYFHYRNLDVSTLKELARRWAPAVAAGVGKQSTHVAIEDIRESIAELRHYREHFLRAAQGG
jgi:oligoribonuclease